MTSGYVARDIKKLVRVAVLRSLREQVQLDDDPDNGLEGLFKKLNLNSNDNGDRHNDDNKSGNYHENNGIDGNDSDERGERGKLNEELKKWKLRWSDFEYAYGVMKPSQKVEFETMIPYRRWSDIGGYYINYLLFFIYCLLYIIYYI